MLSLLSPAIRDFFTGERCEKNVRGKERRRQIERPGTSKRTGGRWGAAIALWACKAFPSVLWHPATATLLPKAEGLLGRINTIDIMYCIYPCHLCRRGGGFILSFVAPCVGDQYITCWRAASRKGLHFHLSCGLGGTERSVLFPLSSLLPSPWYRQYCCGVCVASVHVFTRREVQ